MIYGPMRYVFCVWHHFLLFPVLIRPLLPFEQTLYNENCTADPTDCRFDQFFAMFTAVQHSNAVFSLFMYDEKLDRILGAERVPDLDDTDDEDTEQIFIINYDGKCRRDRYYNASTRTRVPVHDSSLMTNYENCSYSPQNRLWYKKSRELGVGRAAWTEPYMFHGSQGIYGIAYVAPIQWKGRFLTFVVGVTMQTLSLAISHEVIQMPPGSVWMVVTPGVDVVSSSNKDTFIGSEWSCWKMSLGTVGI